MIRSAEGTMEGRDPEAVIAGYLEASNRNDVDAALGHLADDFELEFAGGPILDKGALAGAFGWDVGTRGRVRWEVVSREGRAVEIEGEETNAFLELLGLGPLPFRSRFTVGPGGRIRRQRHRVDWSGVSVDDALAPVIEWAREHEPDELEEIYPDGSLSYTEEAGRRWVSLLRRWTDATPTDEGER